MEKKRKKKIKKILEDLWPTVISCNSRRVLKLRGGSGGSPAERWRRETAARGAKNEHRVREKGERERERGRKEREGREREGKERSERKAPREVI